jgi:hypothetical protein
VPRRPPGQLAGQQQAVCAGNREHIYAGGAFFREPPLCPGNLGSVWSSVTIDSQLVGPRFNSERLHQRNQLVGRCQWSRAGFELVFSDLCNDLWKPATLAAMVLIGAGSRLGFVILVGRVPCFIARCVWTHSDGREARISRHTDRKAVAWFPSNPAWAPALPTFQGQASQSGGDAHRRQ